MMKRTRVHVPGWLVLVAFVPMLIDVVTQIVGLRESDGFWRSLTGALAVLIVALWAYPRLDVDLAPPMRVRAIEPAE